MERLGTQLRDKGFKAVISQQSFRRATKDGWLGLHLAFVTHDEDFDVVLNAAVRFSDVQDALLGSDKEAKQSATIGCEYGRLTGQGQFRWTIASEGDVTPVASAIFNACSMTMIPFLEKYTCRGTVLDALSQNDATSILISPIDERRSRLVTLMRSMKSGDQSA
jgi:hypothetical protein